MNFIFLICFASYTYWILGRACLGCGCGLVCRCLQCPMKISHHKVHFKRCLFCFFVSYFLYSVVNVFLMVFCSTDFAGALGSRFVSLNRPFIDSSVRDRNDDILKSENDTNEDEWRRMTECLDECLDFLVLAVFEVDILDISLFVVNLSNQIEVWTR